MKIKRPTQISIKYGNQTIIMKYFSMYFVYAGHNVNKTLDETLQMVKKKAKIQNEREKVLKIPLIRIGVSNNAVCSGLILKKYCI